MNKSTLPAVSVILLSFILLQSCSVFGSGEEGLDFGTYEGIYAYGPEINSFAPCSEENEEWWVLPGDTDLVEQYQELNEGVSAIVYARLEGKPSEEGEFGSAGDYRREFEVEEVVELRYSTPDDCN